ncbi:MAG TPA: hypothetical protein VGM07_08690 [Stellaceae bacterium]|jgi:hypothetical protein
MNSIEDRLRAIGFQSNRSAAQCWRVERAGAARRSSLARSEPTCSLALSLWLERLGDRRRPAVYRVRPIAENN